MASSGGKEPNGEDENVLAPLPLPLQLPPLLSKDFEEGMPERLKKLVPEDVKLQRIMLKTSRFIRREGTKMEVVLRIKQAGNPNFNFLFAEDELYPLLRWLIDSKVDLEAAGTAGVAADQPERNERHEEREEPEAHPNNSDLEEAEEEETKVTQEEEVMRKTADFVSRKGLAFEDVLRRRECSNPKFGFLFPGAAGHTTYKEILSLRLQEIENEEKKAQRLMRVRKFFQKEEEEKRRNIEKVQKSAMETAEEERKKRQKTLSSLRDVFTS